MATGPGGVADGVRGWSLRRVAGLALLGLVFAGLMGYAAGSAPWIVAPAVLAVGTGVAALVWQGDGPERGEAAALREALRRKDEDLRGVLGVVSHELRTPLTVVSGYVDLLRARRGALEPGAVTMVDRLHEASLHLRRLVDDLVDFGQIERGGLDVEARTADLSPTLFAVAEGLRQRPGGARLVLEVPPTLLAYADPARVAQATTNLITNALKYAPTGPVVLRAGASPECRRSVRVEVEDSGPGIAAEEQVLLWERYVRGAGVAKVVQGFGIGLAVVKAVAEAQGGRVGLHSAPARGSRFWFEVPVGRP